MTNWFDSGGENYARFRPEYPLVLSAYLADLAPGRGLAVDVGCGNGQLTTQLASHFDAVIGLDPSEDQINNTPTIENIRFLCAPAEALPVPDAAADIVTAAQAAHWFDLPAFYAEARRAGRQGAILALISYGVLQLDDDLRDRFARFYYDEIGPFWPPERRLVDSGYADIDFPFEGLPTPDLSIDRDWDLGQLLGYVSTWSAVRQARDAGRDDLLTRFAAEFETLWGDSATRRRVSWPIAMRLGRL
jgi:SAM-dependent methyltransferase